MPQTTKFKKGDWVIQSSKTFGDKPKCVVISDTISENHNLYGWGPYIYSVHFPIPQGTSVGCGNFCEDELRLATPLEIMTVKLGVVI